MAARGHVLIEGGEYNRSAVERFLQRELENDFPAIVEGVRAGEMAPRHVGVLRRLAFMLGARHPSMEAYAGRFAGASIVEADALANSRGDLFPALLADGGLEFKVFFDAVLRSVAHAMVVVFSSQLPWPVDILRSKGRRFVLGDRPSVGWLHRRPTEEGPFGEFGYRICVPLDPLHAVVCGYEVPPRAGSAWDAKVDPLTPIKVIDVADDVVERSNLAQVAHARQVVVANSDDDFPADMAPAGGRRRPA